MHIPRSWNTVFLEAAGCERIKKQVCMCTHVTVECFIMAFFSYFIASEIDIAIAD